MENSIVSTLAGSVAGAIGLFAAYPFDSLKTKAQTFKGGMLSLSIYRELISMIKDLVI